MRLLVNSSVTSVSQKIEIAINVHKRQEADVDLLGYFMKAKYLVLS